MTDHLVITTRGTLHRATCSWAKRSPFTPRWLPGVGRDDFTCCRVCLPNGVDDTPPTNPEAAVSTGKAAVASDQAAGYAAEPERGLSSRSGNQTSGGAA